MSLFEENVKVSIGFGDDEPAEFDAVAVLEYLPPDSDDTGKIPAETSLSDIYVYHESNGRPEKVSILWLVNKRQQEGIVESVNQDQDDDDYDGASLMGRIA